MKKYYFFMSLFFLTMYPRLTAPKESKVSSITSLIKINEFDCTLPAINPKKYFPFGQKSNHFKLSCIRDNFSKFEIISQKLPIDRDNIYRWPLTAMSLKNILGDTLESIKPFLSIYLKEAFGDHDRVIPKILYFKKNIVLGSIPSSIIGVEFCFENAQKTIPGLSRIALFFVQNITKKEDVKTANKIGINHLTLYNAEKNVLILSNTLDTENIIDTIFKKLIANYKEQIPNLLSTIIENKVTSIGKNQIGLIIETTDNEQKTVDDYKDTYGLHYIPLTDHNYLFYKNSADLYKTHTKYFIGSLKNQSIPINSNYHLYGTIMGYNEKDIEFKYQFEEYLRSINKINSDNTIAWPYDISDHKEAFDKWVKKTWESTPFINAFFTPHINQKYQDNKKETSAILKKMQSEYILNAVKKAKNLPEEQHTKKIENLSKTLQKLTKEKKGNAALRLSNEIKIAVQEKEQNKNMLLYKIPKVSTQPFIKIKEYQDKKENKSAQENQSALTTKSLGSYLTNSANKATQLMGKATRLATQYFVYTQEGEEENSPSTNRNKEIIPSTSTIETENTSDNQLIKSQTKPTIESKNKELNISENQSPMEPTNPIIKTEQGSSENSANKATRTTTNKEITSSKSLLNTSPEEVNETNERSIGNKIQQSKNEELNIANQSLIKPTNPVIETKKDPVNITVVEEEPQEGSWGWGWGKKLLDKVTNRLADHYFDNYFVDTEAEKETDGSTNTTSTGPKKDIVRSQDVVKPDTVDDRSNDYNEKQKSKNEELNISNQSPIKPTNPVIETKKDPVNITVVEEEPQAGSWGWGWGKKLLDKVTNRLADNYFVDTEAE